MKNPPAFTLVSSNPVTFHPLSRVMGRLHATLAPALDRAFWIRAEIGSASERAGAFYGELIETDARGTVIAKIRCTIWAADLQRIRARWSRAGMELELRQGTVVGLQCAVQFHATYGLSVRALDIDPSFAIGELELRRQRILANLTRDGVLGLNAARPLQLLPNRILLITSRAGAAFHDFTQALQAHPRFGFRVYLADCVVQGPRTEASVLEALSLAEDLSVDLVVVVRGGGSKLDLGWLDSERVARRIAALRVPVWTGIGHETDTSVLDAVAAQSFRTPTAAAEALVGRFERVATRTAEASARLHSALHMATRSQHERVARASTRLQLGSQRMLELRRAELDVDAHALRAHVTTRLSRTRAAWASHAHRLKQSTHVRLSVAHQRLRQREVQLPAVARRALEQSAEALRQSHERIRRTRLAERFSRERDKLEERTALLRQRGATRTAAAATILAAEATALRTHLAARLSAARLALAPQAQRLRGVVDVRTRISSSRLVEMHERVAGATGRALSQREQALGQLREKLTQERVSARYARERSTLLEHQRLLRASDPQLALSRGFSLTYSASGSLLRSIEKLAPGQTVTTQLADGHFEATVRAVEENENHE